MQVAVELGMTLCCIVSAGGFFVFLCSWFSSIVIALGWERGHVYRSWRRAAYTLLLELNISSSEQPSPPSLWSGSDCLHIQAPCNIAMVPLLLRTHTCISTHLHTRTHTDTKNTHWDVAITKVPYLVLIWPLQRISAVPFPVFFLTVSWKGWNV